VIQSDNAEAFTTPTARITFAQATAAGAQLLSANGAITDDWWRVNYTIAGTAPSFTFGVAIGIR
jgi:hypothetical protein